MGYQSYARPPSVASGTGSGTEAVVGGPRSPKSNRDLVPAVAAQDWDVGCNWNVGHTGTLVVLERWLYWNVGRNQVATAA